MELDPDNSVRVYYPRLILHDPTEGTGRDLFGQPHALVRIATRGPAPIGEEDTGELSVPEEHANCPRVRPSWDLYNDGPDPVDAHSFSQLREPLELGNLTLQS